VNGYTSPAILTRLFLRLKGGPKDIPERHPKFFKLRLLTGTLPGMYRAIFFFFFSCGLLAACGQPEAQTVLPPDTASATTVPVTAGYRFEIFPNADSLGALHGFGYDIYLDDKKLIHQEGIPGEPGSDGFVSETEAGIIAALVIEKLGTGNGLPTLTHAELADRGITLKH
jgi:hypothetical protein